MVYNSNGNKQISKFILIKPNHNEAGMHAHAYTIQSLNSVTFKLLYIIVLKSPSFRDRLPGPTGTVRGLPVSTTSMLWISYFP